MPKSGLDVLVNDPLIVQGLKSFVELADNFFQFNHVPDGFPVKGASAVVGQNQHLSSAEGSGGYNP